MRLGNSYVKHLFFRCGTQFNEGRGNNIRGILKDGKFKVRLINSFNEETSIKGRSWSLGPFIWACGTAYGYSAFPNGLFYFGPALKIMGRIYLTLPSRRGILIVSLDILEEK